MAGGSPSAVPDALPAARELRTTADGAEHAKKDGPNYLEYGVSLRQERQRVHPKGIDCA